MASSWVGALGHRARWDLQLCAAVRVPDRVIGTSKLQRVRMEAGLRERGGCLGADAVRVTSPMIGGDGPAHVR